MIELSRTQDEEVGDGTTSVIILGMFWAYVDLFLKKIMNFYPSGKSFVVVVVVINCYLVLYFMLTHSGKSSFVMVNNVIMKLKLEGQLSHSLLCCISVWFSDKSWLMNFRFCCAPYLVYWAMRCLLSPHSLICWIYLQLVRCFMLLKPSLRRIITLQLFAEVIYTYCWFFSKKISDCIWWLQ